MMTMWNSRTRTSTRFDGILVCSSHGQIPPAGGVGNPKYWSAGPLCVTGSLIVQYVLPLFI